MLLGIPGGWEWVVVLAVILLLFGSAKLPKLARSLGSSMTEFKKGLREGDKDGDGDDDEKKNLDSSTDAKEKEKSAEA